MNAENAGGVGLRTRGVSPVPWQPASHSAPPAVSLLALLSLAGHVCSVCVHVSTCVMTSVSDQQQLLGFLLMLGPLIFFVALGLLLPKRRWLPSSIGARGIVLLCSEFIQAINGVLRLFSGVLSNKGAVFEKSGTYFFLNRNKEPYTQIDRNTYVSARFRSSQDESVAVPFLPANDLLLASSTSSTTF